MADGKGRPIVPPVQVTDSLDKVNPGDIRPIQHWDKSIVPALIIYSLLLIFFVLLTIAWVVTHSTSYMDQTQMINGYLVLFFLFIIDSILLYGLFHAMHFMAMKTKRENLVDLSRHQAMLDHFTHQMEQTFRMQDRYMDMLNERAKRSIYQGVLSVADSHDNSPTNTTITGSASIEEDIDNEGEFGLTTTRKELV